MYLFSALPYWRASTMMIYSSEKRREPRLKWSWEASRGSSHTLPLALNCKPYRRDLPCRLMLLYHPSRRKKGFPASPATVQPVRDSHNSANERPGYFELPVYSSGLFVYNHLPNIPISSTRSVSFLLFPRLAYGFAITCLS